MNYLTQLYNDECVDTINNNMHAKDKANLIKQLSQIFLEYIATPLSNPKAGSITGPF